MNLLSPLLSSCQQGVSAFKRPQLFPRLSRAVHSTAIDTLRNQYFLRCQWAEKEPMDVYLRHAYKKASKFVSSSQLSAKEKDQYKALRTWYKQRYSRQECNLIPFNKLEALGKTFEIERGDYLTNDEVAFYLELGVLGPVGLKTLSKENLQRISATFQNFHKVYNRNLGSVFSMLKNRCLFELATNSELLKKVSSILGNNIMLCNFTINELAPKMGKSTIETGGLVHSLNCHSDLASGSQYHFEPETNHIRNLTLDNRCVNVWVSISGTDTQNAPLYFFPRTHHWEITTPFTHLDRAQNNPKRLNHILKLLSFKHGSAPRRIGLYNVEFRDLLSSEYKNQLQKIRRTEIYTQAGECIFFNAHTRHGSGFNSSSNMRLAVTLRFNTAMTEAGGAENAGSVVTQTERAELGIVGDKRKPMIQLMGTQHHPNNLPIDISKVMTWK